MWATSWYRVNRSPCLFPLSSVKAIFCVPRNALEPDCQRRCGKSSAETVFPGVSDLSSLHQGFLNVPSSVSCPLCRRWCHNLWWTSQALDPFSGSMWNPQLHQSPSWLLSSYPVHHTPPPWTGNDKDTQPTPSWPLSWDRVPRLWWFTTNTTCRSNLAHTITFYSLTVSGFFLWWGWGGGCLFPHLLPGLFVGLFFVARRRQFNHLFVSLSICKRRCSDPAALSRRSQQYV